MKQQPLAAILGVILLTAVSCGDQSQQPTQTAADANAPQDTIQIE